jgi:tRNA A37 threonylcarbamoyladenosine biosynthesis protein TsaE
MESVVRSGRTAGSSRAEHRLRSVLDEVISNGSRFVLIGGDAGAGKTTIIEALLPTSSDHGPTARPS